MFIDFIKAFVFQKISPVREIEVCLQSTSHCGCAKIEVYNARIVVYGVKKCVIESFFTSCFLENVPLHKRIT